MTTTDFTAGGSESTISVTPLGAGRARFRMEGEGEGGNTGRLYWAVVELDRECVAKLADIFAELREQGT